METIIEPRDDLHFGSGARNLTRLLLIGPADFGHGKVSRSDQLFVLFGRRVTASVARAPAPAA